MPSFLLANEKYPCKKGDRVNALLSNYISFAKPNFIVDPFQIDFGIDTLFFFQLFLFTEKTYIILLASGKHHNFFIVLNPNAPVFFLIKKCLQVKNFSSTSENSRPQNKT